MKFPKNLYIYGDIVPIKLVSRKTLGGAFGDYHDGTIRIWRGTKGQLRLTTLLHEILHLCWEHANGDEMSDNLEEGLIERMELPLYEVLNKNFYFDLDGRD